ncbi:HTH-type transcriptional activator RhaS [Microbulbifer sp. NBRC 101763]|uniref:helix-turn-helix transcriptional regulator n=1 Tax=unclassified Microbulbifer TaxID=2619833 RepID=UPI0030A91A88
MDIPIGKEQNRFVNREVVVECRHCGSLFELKMLSVPYGESIGLNFSSPLNLIMVAAGTALVKGNQSSFELTVGQTWLASSNSDFRLSSDLRGHSIIIICVGIRAAMITRFYQRYDNTLLHKRNGINIDSSTLPEDKAPIVLPGCELTRLTLDSFRLFSLLGDDGLNTLKLEELLLLKLNSDHGPILAAELLNHINPLQENFRRFMEENFTKNWSVATFAKHIGMSLTSFKNMFGQVFRESSPKSWINERRLRYADAQLRTTRKRLIDIALDSGFSSQSYFTQLYKLKYGVSPLGARQQCG